MLDHAPLGELSPEQFLRDYWQKQPLLIRNAFPDFEPPISPDELAGLACEAEVESRLIQFDPKGDSWQLEQGPFAEERFAELPARHWTLLVQAVDHWVPDAADLMQLFNFIPNWRLDDLMISYAVDGGGVGPHYDNYDVFLLQASGTRRWELGAPCTEHSPRRADAPVMILPQWEPEQSFTLQPGDMLYLPPGLAHNGVAVGDDCMTLSIGFRAPAHNEILRSFSDFVGEQLGRDLRYTDPDLRLQDNPGELSADALDRVEQILRHYLTDRAQLGHWFGRYMTEPKYPEQQEAGETISPDELRDWFAQGGGLRRNEGTRLAYTDSADGRLALYADGKQYSCAAHQKTLVQALCSHPQLLLELPIDDASCQLLCQLIEANCFYPLEP